MRPCRHHLALEIRAETMRRQRANTLGSMTRQAVALDPYRMPRSCRWRRRRRWDGEPRRAGLDASRSERFARLAHRAGKPRRKLALHTATPRANPERSD